MSQQNQHLTHAGLLMARSGDGVSILPHSQGEWTRCEDFSFRPTPGGSRQVVKTIAFCKFTKLVQWHKS